MTPAVIGLDVSSSKIGIAVLDDNKKILTSEVIKLKSDDTLENRALMLENKLEKLKKYYFDMKLALSNKSDILQKQLTTIQTNYDDLSNKNQVNIGNIQSDKYNLSWYQQYEILLIRNIYALAVILMLLIFIKIGIFTNKIGLLLVILVILSAFIYSGYIIYYSNP